MARLVGQWDDREGWTGSKYPKSVQTFLGQYLEQLHGYCDRTGQTIPAALRKLWGDLMKSDTDVPPVRTGAAGDGTMVTVPVTEAMFDRIEWFRRSYPRSAVLRAMTAAALKMEGDIKQ